MTTNNDRLTLHERISALIKLGDNLKGVGSTSDVAIKARNANQWFTPDNIVKSLAAIATEFLNQTKLEDWVSNYKMGACEPKRVGLVLAGNIPLVGFHDFLCSFVCGHKSLIKCSSKDEVLVSYILAQLSVIDSRCSSYFELVDRLERFDAVIATGGQTAATHFLSYFGKYPHIIRKNRSSVAVMYGDESESVLHRLGADVFDYFGLGCRSVSKIYLPAGFDLDRLFKAFLPYQDIINHHKYKNNYDYSHAIYILAQDHFFTNDIVILREQEALASRISCVHYEYYNDVDKVVSSVSSQMENIQCVTSQRPLGDLTVIPFGKCQQPSISDYADHVDTMEFLLNLN